MPTKLQPKALNRGSWSLLEERESLEGGKLDDLTQPRRPGNIEGAMF